MGKNFKVGSRKEQGLNEIKKSTNDMFIQVETMFELSKLLLETESKEIAIQIIEEDAYMDNLLSDLTIEITNYIIKEQPIAIDLRICLGTLKLICDIERMGDYCKNYAKFSLKEEMNSKTQQTMVQNIISEILFRLIELKNAYNNNDHQAAKNLAKRDQEIDDLTNELIKNTNEKLTKCDNYDEVKSLTKIVGLARVFERAGDHIVNVCEQISYINKGQIYHYS